jgi:hypothetical protein
LVCAVGHLSDLRPAGSIPGACHHLLAVLDARLSSHVWAGAVTSSSNSASCSRGGDFFAADENGSTQLLVDLGSPRRSAWLSKFPST